MAEPHKTSISHFPGSEISSSDQQWPQRSHRMHIRQPSQELDSLLQDLSPTKTLDVFSSNSDVGAESSGSRDDSWASRGLQTVSNTERAFGVRVAQTMKQLRAWCWELEDWKWPGTFQSPPVEQLATGRLRLSSVAEVPKAEATATHDNSLEEVEFIDPESTNDTNMSQDDINCGSLPAHQVRIYEKRVGEIQEQLEEMDVEELKNRVLDVHTPSRSRHPSMSGLEQALALSSAEFRHLDDYTALVTATILQALPYLSRLTRLLCTWSIRLTVLQTSVSFLSGLADAQSALHVASSLLDLDSGSDCPKPISVRDSFNREVFNTIKDDLQEKVTMLAQQMDRMLDDLEGREDTVPDRWIEDFERLEASYTSWVVQAGECVLELESRASPAAKDTQGSHPLPTTHIHESSEPDQIHSRSGEGEKTDESNHNEKHDTLTESFRISVEKANGCSMEGIPATSNDYILGAALTSHPPSDLPGANRSATDAPALPYVAEASPKPYSYHSNSLERLPSDPVVSDSEGPTTLPDRHRRKSLSAKLNALMGREEKPPTMRPTNTPVRPFERANSGFGRLFNKQRENSDSAESSASESRQQSPSATAKPNLKRLSLRNKRDVPKLNSADSSGKDLDEMKANTEASEQDTEDVRESPYSSAVSARSPHSVLRKDLSDIQEAADAFLVGQQTPLMGQQEDFVARPFSEPEASPLVQENNPIHFRKTFNDELEETFEPDVPVATDEFYNMFVDSLPTSPAEERKPGLWAGLGAERPKLNSRSLTVTDDNFGKTQRRSMHHGPPPSLTKRHTVQGLPMYEGEKSRAAQSSLVEGEQPQPAISVPQKMPQASQSEATENIENDVDNGPQSKMTESLSAQPSEAPNPGIVPNLEMEEGRAVEGKTDKSLKRPVFKRASMTSIEHFPRSELRSVEIRRTNSQRSTGSRSLPQTPVNPAPDSLHQVLHHDSPSGLRVPTNTSQSTSTERDSSRVRHISELVKSSLSSPPTAASPHQMTSEASSPQQRSRKLSDPARDAEESPSKPPLKHPPKQAKLHRTFGEDQLERQISSILTTIPAHIRLSSTPSEPRTEPKSRLGTKRLSSNLGPLTPAKTRPPADTGSSTPTTPSTESPHQPTLTLVPARSSAPPGSRQLRGGTPSSHTDSPPASSESGVKLYHLMQPGRTDPIKLFVRLVGEDGARVMVRVGGGWADLGDWLREFALHHGRRTVSGSGLLTMSQVGSSGSGSGGKARGGMGRPGSAMEIRRERVGSSASATSRPGSSGEASVSSLKTRPEPMAESGLVNSVEASSPETPSLAPVRPDAMEGDEVVRIREKTPTSTGSARVRILEDEEHDRVSLSGPTAKREMSAEKQKWVQDMLGQARKVSSERVERVGGTRRVLFRGASSASNGTGVKEMGRGE